MQRLAPKGPSKLDAPLKLLLARWAGGISPASLLLAQADWWSHLLASPSKQMELAASAYQKWDRWLHHIVQAGHGGSAHFAEPRPHDKRFVKPQWHRPLFAALAQGFLLQEQWWDEAMHGVRGLSMHHEQVAAFMARQWLDMWSPSNFLLTNPEVLDATWRSGGRNLLNGGLNGWRDFVAVQSGGKPRGVQAFVPGQTVAVTPGTVVFRNSLIELIQYQPRTQKVDREPVLIVPSWIMKYYILDLVPGQSLVQYLVQQGHTVFMISWRNPQGSDAHLGLSDYLETGLLQALQAVQLQRPRARIHAAGYCLGGTLLAMAAAILGAGEASPLRTVSLLAAQVDFEEPGELGLFIDDSQIAFLEDLMAERGYLDGPQMAGAFALINSKDLVWSKLVHEYLMGASTPMTALRAWNADATRLPARMHGEYLKQLYLHNDLAQGHYLYRGKPVNLDAIEVPMFVVATEADHVSPWRSVYKIHRLVRASVSFVLASGGHNVGIVSPAGKAAHPQASYRYAHHAARQANHDPEVWLERARPHPGSWWPSWHRWLHAHSSGTVAAHPVLSRQTQAIENDAAPGMYVH